MDEVILIDICSGGMNSTATWKSSRTHDDGIHVDELIFTLLFLIENYIQGKLGSYGLPRPSSVSNKMGSSRRWSSDQYPRH